MITVLRVTPEAPKYRRKCILSNLDLDNDMQSEVRPKTRSRAIIPAAPRFAKKDHTLKNILEFKY